MKHHDKPVADRLVPVVQLAVAHLKTVSLLPIPTVLFATHGQIQNRPIGVNQNLRWYFKKLVTIIPR